MAKKKYKNQKIEQEELKPIAIGAFESRKKTSIGIFLILTTFILVVIFLPEITNKINEYLNPASPTPTTPNNPTDDGNNKDPDDTNKEDETFYEFEPNLKIERDDVIVNNFSIDTTANNITYSVTNNTNSYQDMETLNYFIEIYNADKTLVERVKLVPEGLLAGGAFQTFTRPITTTSASTIKYIVLVKKSLEDYPEVNLVTDNNENSTLICSNAHEKVTYKFTKDELKEVTSIVEYLISDNNYIEIYNNYQTLVNSYNNTIGITSNIFTNASGFNITTVINLEEASRSYIFNADTFALNTSAKEVNFEMESLGFDCN